MEKIQFPNAKKSEVSETINEKLDLGQLEQIAENLSEYEEPCSFYRGLSVKDAFLSLFGKLKLEADRKDDIIGQRDNATLNSSDAIAYGRTSLTKDGKKFVCAIGFDPMPGALIEPSRLGRWNQFRISGFVIAREIIIRFAGKRMGKPGKVLIFSPKGFYKWYLENIA